MGLYHGQQGKVNESLDFTVDFSELEGMARTGLLSLSVQLGIKALNIMLEDEVISYAGEKGKHNPSRTAYRHGHERTSVVLGGQKIAIQKPRVRSKDGNGELPIETLIQFQAEDALNNAALRRVLHGVSVRNYIHTLDETPEGSHSTSKSSISRRFTKETERLMNEFINRRIDDYYPVIMMDGVKIGGYMVIVALGISKAGDKKVLGIIEGSTENAKICTDLIQNMIKRGLDASENRLFVLDGGKGLHKAVKDVFGENAYIQRCQIHKRRNVQSYLPESEQRKVKAAMNKAYMEFEYNEAKKKLELLARELEFKYPSAAASLREGLEETLTVHKLKVPGLLRTTLSNTNPIESAIGTALDVIGRVKNWQSGDQILRWASAGFMLAEEKFRAIKGHKQIPFLADALSNKKPSELLKTS
jgi:transposase-like protein